MGAWRLMPSQVPSSSLINQKSESQVVGHSFAQQNVPSAIDLINCCISKQRQQHCFFGSEISSPGSVKQEQQQPVHPFFSEWPSTKESWSNLDDDGSNKNIFSSTQLSISIPRASSDFSSRSAAYSPNGELTCPFLPICKVVFMYITNWDFWIPWFTYRCLKTMAVVKRE